jgi:glycosyltransferase involved in cell wall biosynthesis
MKLSIVIPVYNEEENLEPLHDELVAVAGRMPEHTWEYIFVDDGSKDRSLEVLKKIQAKDERMVVISFARNFGQTAAMSCGIKTATGDIIIPMDADRQNDPADIPDFLDKIDQGYGCVSGWRKDRKDGLFFRKIPSWMANRLISWATGVHIHDYGCSLKAYRRDIIQDIDLYGEMHRFIPVYAAGVGAKVTEIVVHHRPRVAGVSKYGLFRVFKVLLDLVVVRFLTTYFSRPMHFFGVIGFASLAGGLFAEGVAILLKIVHLRDFVSTPLPVVGAMLIIVGVQFILFGLMAEVLMRTYFEAQRRKPYSVKEMISTTK